jgi:UDP-N-acetylglucosamine:LPS N-acetylglucosamine transferase
MVTRAGGGSVNDAVACRVPFVCVDEPGQAQVREILDACVERKLTRSIPWDRFLKDPVGTARSQWEDESNRLKNHDLTTRLRAIPNQAEKVIVEAVRLLLDR